MQSSEERDSTCFVKVDTKLKRYKSCCSEGRDWSFVTSSSGLGDASARGTEFSFAPSVELGVGSWDIEEVGKGSSRGFQVIRRS